MQNAVDTEALIDEIERYLVAVEAFRREGCEPRWLDSRTKSTLT